MGETDYNALLYDKMKAEQDKYRDWLLSQLPEEILNHTYEYTMREDIVMCMEELELSPKQAKALLRSPCPLDDVYKEFKDREVEHMLNQASTDRLELAKLLNISDLQMSYITNVEAGHGLIKVGSSLVPFANKFPKNTKLYKLMTTKPGESA